MRLFVAAALLLACARALASPLLPSASPDFIITLNTTSVAMGKTVAVSIACTLPPTPSGTVFWPFVNGSQWGAFVTCFVQPPAAAAPAADQACSIELPLPRAGDNTLQFAVFKQGAAGARACAALCARDSDNAPLPAPQKNP